MKKFLTVLLSIVCVSCFSLFFIGCNNENDNDNANNNDQIVEIYNTYVAYAESNGETPLSYEDWLASIKGEKGDKGDKGDTGATGQNGKDGITPTIEIIDGYWYINGKNTNVKAEGKDGVNGENGQDGVTPTIEIIDGYWYINGENSGVKAEGKDGVNGENGQDGATPTIEIIDGYWYINGDNTGVKAEGQDGLNGMNGKGIKSAVIDSNGDLIITFDDNTWVNAGNIVPKNPILDENNKIIFNNISIEDNNGFIKVENGTTTFSFLDEIEIRGNANYTVSTDITGLNVIPTKTVNLEIGDNVLYVLETCGNDANLYTITIRRDLHVVTFNTNGGTAVEPILVKTGEMITAPTSQRNGYGLSWEFDFETPITEDITIDAFWTAIFTATGYLTEYGRTLTEIVVPETIDGIVITNIVEYAFAGCEKLTRIVLPNTITSIGDSAFMGCSSLMEIEIPKSVIEIGSCILQGATSLETVKIPFIGERKDGTGSTQFGYQFGYLFYNNWNIPISLKTVVITGGDNIKSSAFSNCRNIVNVIISDSILTVGQHAFSGCTSLTDIYCEAESKPIYWDDEWMNFDVNATVHWGYKGE